MRPRRAASATFLLLGGCSAGWFLLSPQGGGPRGIRFSHLAHAKQELTCEVCHATAETEDRAGVPGRDVCITCHEVKSDKPAKDFERRITEAAELRFPLWSASPDVIFSHRAHLAKGYACADCHGKVDETTALDETVVARMEGCIECHAREREPRACETCHTTIREDARPATHDAAFLKFHGALVRGGPSDEEEARCRLCHSASSPSSCDRCHAEIPPADHGEFWRRHGHGFAAEVDRERCATCHREDSCVRCHEEVRPSSHAGAWGGAFSPHCFSCHVPLGENTCFACHRGTPSHNLAPPKPPPPHPGPGADCRACHLPGTLLTHADNGMDCNICHN